MRDAFCRFPSCGARAHSTATQSAAFPVIIKPVVTMPTASWAQFNYDEVIRWKPPWKPSPRAASAFPDPVNGSNGGHIFTAFDGATAMLVMSVMSLKPSALTYCVRYLSLVVTINSVGY